jgi:hypothetical protein
VSDFNLRALDHTIEYNAETKELAAKFRLPLRTLRQTLSEGRLEDAGAPAGWWNEPDWAAGREQWRDLDELCRQGAKSSQGRPITTVDGQAKLVYRVLKSALVGEVDPFYDLDHVCRGPLSGACANPWHCQMLTPSEHRALTLLRQGIDSPVSRAFLRAGGETTLP